VAALRVTVLKQFIAGCVREELVVPDKGRRVTKHGAVI
jgi:hypothetical protein